MNSGQFTSERLRGNSFAKGNKPNKTSFKKGQLVGEKSYNWKGGIQKHKDGYYIYLGVEQRMRLGRYNWENVNGEIPLGHVIFHKDGDCYNDNINNLEIISRAELAKRNRKYANA